MAYNKSVSLKNYNKSDLPSMSNGREPTFILNLVRNRFFSSPFISVMDFSRSKSSRGSLLENNTYKQCLIGIYACDIRFKRN